ncbi:hypothetical protein M413DRAFT_29769 [Hebeloma cylindrosporum]|uniref:F-box domain-containing protein n=1 Tax=Hebeloma cylindrosporum TaxID=76867 RepID=A0A0C2XM68_HEBCY|nr:hypothetical protein M413DRAFT_29769 [Hebeloma cylindrosporum h7]
MDFTKTSREIERSSLATLAVAPIIMAESFKHHRLAASEAEIVDLSQHQLSNIPCDPSLRDISITIPHFLAPMLTHNALPSSQRTYDVDRQIDALLQQRRQLEIPEKQALKKIAVCEVASSPFRRLSLDLLQEIGYCMLAPDGSGLNPCITLSHVSSSWRTALLGSPRLWTDLSLCFSDDKLLKSKVLEYFGRAGVRPLKLNIKRPKTPSWSPGWNDFFQWLLYTWPKIHQVTVLEMPFPLLAWPETDKAVDFQCLQSLICRSSTGRDNSWDVSPILGSTLPIFFSQAPQLVAVTVGHELQCYPRQGFSFPWSQLTRLSLLEPIAPWTWMEILAECIRLKSGSFSLLSRAGHTGTIGGATASPAQTSLQNLYLSFVVYKGDAFQIFRRRIFESVAFLVIDGIKQNNLGEQYGLKSHFPSLDHLALTKYQVRSDKILPILLNNRDVSQISLEMDGPPRLQIPFFRLCSTKITRDTMPYLSKINVIARNDNGIKVDYVKAFSDMVRVWFNGATSNGDIHTQGSYSVQLRMPPTSVQFIPNFYAELQDSTERGLNLVATADHAPGCPSPWYDQA